MYDGSTILYKWFYSNSYPIARGETLIFCWPNSLNVCIGTTCKHKCRPKNSGPRKHRFFKTWQFWSLVYFFVTDAFIGTSIAKPIKSIGSLIEGYITNNTCNMLRGNQIQRTLNDLLSVHISSWKVLSAKIYALYILRGALEEIFQGLYL